MSGRRQVLLRLDPAVHDTLVRWAGDDFRSVNAHIEMLLRRALRDTGRMPKQAARCPVADTPEPIRVTMAPSDAPPSPTGPRVAAGAAGHGLAPWHHTG